MPTRSRTVWKLRSDGQFDCRVGWKINGQGKRDQHRFRLGSDLKEAKRRDQLLRQFWERIEQLKPVEPLWDDETLTFARQIAEGQLFVTVVRQPAEAMVPYCQRVHRLRQAFPMLSIQPELDYGAVFGVRLLEGLQSGGVLHGLAPHLLVGQFEEQDAVPVLHDDVVMGERP